MSSHKLDQTIPNCEFYNYNEPILYAVKVLFAIVIGSLKLNFNLKGFYNRLSAWHYFVKIFPLFMRYNLNLLFISIQMYMITK